MSKIDARNGAFGIVPPEADGAIITGNFWVYDVNPEIANIDYLILEDVIPDRKHPIKMLPNLPDKIKKELEKRINKFEADEFNGFIPLLDKIVELTKEQAV